MIRRIVATALMGAVLLLPVAAFADEAGDLIAKVKNGIKAAQKALSNQKTADADAALVEIAPDVAKLREIAPDNAEAKRQLESYERARKDVDGKLAKSPKPKEPEKPKEPDAKPETDATPAAGGPLDAKVQRGLEGVKKQLDAAANDLKGKNPARCRESLGKAEKEMQKVRDWNKGKVDEGHPDVVDVVQRFASLESEIGRLLTELAAESDRILSEADVLIEGDLASFASARAKLEESGAVWKKVAEMYKANPGDMGEELVKVRDHGARTQARRDALVQVLRDMSGVEKSLKSGEHYGGAEAAKHARSADEELIAVLARHAADIHREHPLIRDVVVRLDALRAKVAAGDVAATWSERLRSKFVREASSGITAEEVGTRLKVYKEGLAALEELGKTAFPSGKGDDLEKWEKLLVAQNERFAASCRELAKGLDGIGERVKQVEASLVERRAAADADKVAPPKPLWFARKAHAELVGDLDRCAGPLTIVAELGGDHGARVSSLRARCDVLLAADKEIEEIRARRLRLEAEGYTGADADALRETVKATVAKAFPGAKVLKNHIVSKGWSSHTVWATQYWVTYKEMHAEAAVEPASRPLTRGGHAFGDEHVMRVTVWLRQYPNKDVEGSTYEGEGWALMLRENAAK